MSAKKIKMFCHAKYRTGIHLYFSWCKICLHNSFYLFVRIFLFPEKTTFKHITCVHRCMYNTHTCLYCRKMNREECLEAHRVGSHGHHVREACRRGKMSHWTNPLVFPSPEKRRKFTSDWFIWKYKWDIRMLQRICIFYILYKVNMSCVYMKWGNISGTLCDNVATQQCVKRIHVFPLHF